LFAPSLPPIPHTHTQQAREVQLAQRRKAHREAEAVSGVADGAVPKGNTPWERVISVCNFNAEALSRDPFKELSRCARVGGVRRAWAVCVRGAQVGPVCGGTTIECVCVGMRQSNAHHALTSCLARCCRCCGDLHLHRYKAVLLAAKTANISVGQ
jgi:hypothetical protein